MTCALRLLGVLSFAAACSSAAPAVAPPQVSAPTDASEPRPDAAVPDAAPLQNAAEPEAPKPFVKDWEKLYRAFDDQRAAPVGSFACDRRAPPELGSDGQPLVICSPRGFLVAGRARRVERIEGSDETKIFVDRGKDDGIESTWKAVIVDRQGMVVSESARVTGLGVRECFLRGPIPRDVAERHGRVVLFPPTVTPPR